MKKTFLIAAGMCLAAIALLRVQLVAKEPAETPAASRGVIFTHPNPEEPPAAPREEFTVELNTGRDGMFTITSVTPAQKMVQRAQAAYEATLSAYEAETTTLELVYEWSVRWMEAAESAAKDGVEKAAAVTAHLERMQKLHAGIEALYKVGSKGGEAKDFAATSYYVAEAERRLAQLQAKPADDAKRDELKRRGVAPAVDDLHSKRTLILGQVPPQAKRRVYDGKDYPYWSETLQTELSAERRTLAIQAMTAFGANGYGLDAARRIVEVMRGYPTLSIDDGPVAQLAVKGMAPWAKNNSPEGRLTIAAIDAFAKIPPAESRPAVLDALHSDYVNERLFAVVVLSSVFEPSENCLPSLVEAMADKDARVRRSALYAAAIVGGGSPELTEAARKLLADPDPEVVRTVIQVVGGKGVVIRLTKPAGTRTFLRPIPALAPDLVAILGRPDAPIANQSRDALRSIGPDALDALEAGVQSSDPKVAATCRALIDEIEKAARERPAR